MADLSKWEPKIQKTIVEVRSTLRTLHAIWEDIGFTEEARDTYCEQAFSHINDLLHDMVHESQQKKDKLLSNSTELMEKLSILTKELGEDMQTGGYENLPLLKIEEVLRSDLHTLQYRKEQRLALLKELRAKEQSLCKILGTQPIGIEEKLPSEEELNSFKLYLETQESEKNRLESNFKEMRREIIKMMDELGLSPSTNFEHLIYKDSENFVFSSNNMTKLKKLKEELKHRMERAKEYVENIKKELIALWKYLDEPERVCHSFLNSYVGYSIATINALEAELERCKEKRKGNIAQYISQVRSELVKLWDLCKFSEAEKGKFKYFLCQTYTEDLLSIHELEVKRLQDFYAANKSVFELLEERNNLWLKMKELLQPTNDPDRLYNRGGQLLMEEKERKKIQKKLPKIEERLRNLIKEYESVNGEVFTVNGMSVEELLKESWEHLNEEKETIKKARKDAKDKSVKKGVLSSTKKTPTLLCTRRTPTNVLKRKLMFSPSPNTSMKRRSMSLKNSGLKQMKGRRIPQIIVSSAVKGSSKKKETSESRSSAATDTTYNQFKEHLEERRELRSSLLNATNKGNVKTPIRTPAKPLRKHIPVAVTPTTTTPKLSRSQLHKSPRSPRLVQSSRLAAVSDLPIIF
ncbi:protein regulator of cytokinesis 1-like [Halictus rubicundus]|uniref:protein regulator of cytokinesis 1-like n=1 Tax=Halictus rubicundus TaxID=77578 RepID=UPI0040363E47